jgi:O-methyltransferase
VKFLVGWFKDTLPNTPIEKLALLRLDGDMYESTMDALTHLYSKLSIGGYIIIDDWGAVPACKNAVIDFRTKFNISEEIIPIDWSGVYWKKLRE